ncbi:NAD(P)H-hydrate dehydratase [Allosphingosinicella flava]|uniref:ADP-dependent (S)-NAD(P)H-hydrate dehydratase n=1 Tax=Allosphingosinicella flava TaxID=2771430 RepID=A0A7T2GJM6_9SPHN|nr:NAD(P)H-hydrate dehydratase [Sphingosinicella flava]QPQ54723.1 NAD(P)H-hydrate dehydratase [Sphingosinicella flava]
MSEPQTLDIDILRARPLPHHPEDGDKEERGRSLFIAGSREVAGAALLAGTAALRAGAGKLQIATARSIATGLSLAMPEARVIAFEEDEAGCLAAASVERLVDLCGHVDALVIGPGMETGDALAALLEAVLDSGASYPLILDAGALHVLPPLAAKLRARKGGTVLLPHNGEMAALLECDSNDVAADPLAAARRAAGHYGAVTVVKGQWSHVVAPDGEAFRYLGGGVGLATSGSGDVLAGIAGGVAARGADALTAALWSVYLHGEAGRILTRDVGRVGFLARELPDLIPKLME